MIGALIYVRVGTRPTGSSRPKRPIRAKLCHKLAGYLLNDLDRKSRKCQHYKIGGQSPGAPMDWLKRSIA